MSTLQGYVQSVLRRKQLMASLVGQFKQNDENTRCINFQFRVAKLSQEKSITIQDYVQVAQ